MNVLEFIQSVSAGGFVAVLVLVLSLIEIAPIKISPLAWIGKRLNKETLEKVNNMEHKLDEHIAGSYRSAIMKFADDIQANIPKTKEQWKEIINAISKYNKHCEDNHIENGLCDEASTYLKREYQERLNERDFAMPLSNGVGHRN